MKEIVLIAFAAGALQGAAPDILIGDFEAASFAGWTLSGSAFGSAPHRPRQPATPPPPNDWYSSVGFLQGHQGGAIAYSGAAGAAGKPELPASGHTS